ncbi:MAG: flavin reductase [Clostridiales bacterium]|nr:flavin reductase [Clostridiales bacterium]
MDFVTAIPSPLFVATTYKPDGKTNACLQSWACFTGNTDGFFAILSAVYKKGHFYKTLKETGVCVLNFPSAACYDRCAATIRNNQWEADEITASGLTAEAAAEVNAPRIQECFLALECEYRWEKALIEGSDHTLLCLEVKNICMDEDHLDEAARGRYGETGYLYNVHYPVGPETFTGKAHDYLAVLKKFRDMGEY